MVVPTTAHAAFDKAAQFLKIKIHYIPIDPYTTCVDVDVMRKHINSRTILVNKQLWQTPNCEQVSLLACRICTKLPIWNYR